MTQSLPNSVKDEIFLYMSNAELELVSAKSIRLVRITFCRGRLFKWAFSQHLEHKFGQSFASKKDSIKAHILAILDKGTSSVSASPASPKGLSSAASSMDATRQGAAVPARSPTKRGRRTSSPSIDSTAYHSESRASELVARAAVVQFAKPGAADGSGKSGKSEPDAVAVSKVPATSLPLVVPRTNQRGAKSTVLVQADRQDEAIDLSGDVGAVGRLTTSSSGVILDLQGHRYAGNFVPCHSHLVVNVGMYLLCSS